MAAAAAWAMAIALLVYNVLRLSFFDDEAIGFFLYRLPARDIVSLLYGNLHEDPPLWPLISHFWIGLAGPEVALLRLLPVLMWLAAVPGTFLLGRRVAGPRGGYLAVITLALFPYGWVYAVSFRWYSFFALLAVWNAWAALCIADRTGTGAVEGGGTGGRLSALCALYVTTGVAMTYTNYVTPVLLFSHFAYVILFHPRRLKALLPLGASWAIIGAAFLPWLPALLSQMGKSVRTGSPMALAMSLYESVGTPCVTPGCLPVAAAVGILGLTAAALVLRQWRTVRFPLLVLMTVTAAMAVTGTIDTKRMLMILPLFAVCLAGGVLMVERRTWLAWVRGSCAAALAVVVASSAVNEIRLDDWTSYRWLVPLRNVLADVRRQAPHALVVTSSYPVLFYLGDEVAPDRGVFEKKQSGPGATRPAGYLYVDSPGVIPLDQYDEAVFIWQPGKAGTFTESQARIGALFETGGYRLVKTDSYLRMSSLFMRFHPYYRNWKPGSLDEMQIVALYFKKAARVSFP